MTAEPAGVVPFGEEIWTLRQPFPGKRGAVGVRMTLVRLAGGGLWVHSPLPVDEAARRMIESLGPVAHLVAPCRMHYLGMPEYARRYPEAVTHGTPLVARKRPGLLRRLLGETPDPGWEGELEQAPLRGHRFLDEVSFYHRRSRTLILADLLMSFHRDASAPERLLAKALGIFERPAMPLELRLTFRDREAARESLRQMLAWDFDRIVLSHGRLVRGDGRNVFRQAFEFLLER